MSIIYRADLTPSKTELLDGWAPGQPWYAGDAGLPLASVAAYRFDDPDGEVGIETLLVRSGDGPVLQVPVTYRAAPLSGADEFLIGTLEHSVLGTRYTYDAVGDPVYLAALATAVLTGAREADQYVETEHGPMYRKSTAEVLGSGTADAALDRSYSAGEIGDISVRHTEDTTKVFAHAIEFTVLRQPQHWMPGDNALNGRWAGVRRPLVLAWVVAR
jgi:hypothetical protein